MNLFQVKYNEQRGLFGQTQLTLRYNNYLLLYGQSGYYVFVVFFEEKTTTLINIIFKVGVPLVANMFLVTLIAGMTPVQSYYYAGYEGTPIPLFGH